MLKGSRYRPAKQPKQPLVYWCAQLLGMQHRSRQLQTARARLTDATPPLLCRGYEASPFCKVVRERLNELELAHVQVISRGWR